MVLCVVMHPLFAQDTLSVMYYNVLNYPGSTPERVQYFRTITSFTQPDVLLITELISEEGALLLLNDGLNTGGVTSYSKALFTNGDDTENMLFYNTNKLSLYSQDTIDTDLRFINEYVLYYHGGGPLGEDTTFLFFYSAHLKSSTGTDNQLKRMEEVMMFKQHLQAKTQLMNVFFGGDLNLYTSSEPAYDSLVMAGPLPLIDPLPAGSWHDSEVFAPYHTQSTRTAQFGGGATGGIDDRFDFILFSEDVLNGGNGVSYVANSCVPFGNDGLHFNKSLLDLPVNTQIPDSVIQALYYMSDHMPVTCKIALEVPQVLLTRVLDIQLFLEGPYSEGTMISQPDFSIPIQQPYIQGPWNYLGNEMLQMEAGVEILDWILLEIRETTGDASTALPSTTIWQQACLIEKNGQVLAANQIYLPVLDVPVSDNLYVVVRHRNHLDMMSAYPMINSNDTASYLFYDALEKTYGGIDGIKKLANGVWGMTAGDSDGNGTINQTDLLDNWLIRAGQTGYLPADLNFDSQVDNSDKNEKRIGNIGKSSVIPE